MSPTPVNVTGVIIAALGSLPAILALIRETHATAHPDAPPLTDADVFAALAYAVASSVAIDENWKRLHTPLAVRHKP
jgi:hypothetical protein